MMNLEEAKKIIEQQDTIIGRQLREIENLKDSVERRKQWIWNAKKEAGYHDSVSFDVVWSETLKKAQEA